MHKPMDPANACPACGSAALPIRYGEPSPEMLDAEARREIVLGGCCVGPGIPVWQCAECGHQWGNGYRPSRTEGSLVTRDEALAAAREELERDPVDPDLWERLRQVFRGETEDTIRLWLTGNSGWLGGERPLDLWRENPAAVLDAARRTVEPWG